MVSQYPPEDCSCEFRGGARRLASRSCPGLRRAPALDLTKPGRKRALSNSSQRRSVSSMKSLLPLALSPSCSTSSDSSPAEEGVGNKLDGYFPELLAKDLQRAPAPLASTPNHRTSMRPESLRPTGSFSPPELTSSCPIAVSPPERTSSVQFRQLLPIQERNAVVSFLDRLDAKYHDYPADLDSVYGTELSRSAEAPSISFRDQSIATTATSMTGSSVDSWSRQSQICDQPRELSWIEMDSDDEDDSGMLIDETLTTLSPRPPTPPGSDSASSSGARTHSPDSFVARFPTHMKPSSIVGGATLSPLPRRHSLRRLDGASKLPDAVTVMPALEPFEETAPRFPSSISNNRRSSSLQAVPYDVPVQNWPKSRSADGPVRRPTDDLAVQKHDEFVDMSVTAIDATSVKETPPTPPLPELHPWFSSGTRPYTAQGNSGDDVVRAVPLPPNVVETLRVSVTCFPETMLLTSSLTTETIRVYSRKVRQPSEELLQRLAPDSPVGVTRKPLWKRVVSYKRSPQAPGHRETPLHSPEQPPQSCASGFLSASRPWTPLQNIFPHCSDYICDALWAHIIAYNYISAVAPKTPPQTRGGKCRPSTSNDSQKDEIPKKAALLLGFGDSRDAGLGAGLSAERIARKLGAALPVSREGAAACSNPRSTSYDNAVREIKAGLLRCIMRLIATAKLMTEDGTCAERMVEMDTNGVDVLFTRSLCEIVRISEDAACEGNGH